MIIVFFILFIVFRLCSFTTLSGTCTSSNKWTGEWRSRFEIRKKGIPDELQVDLEVLCWVGGKCSTLKGTELSFVL